MKKLLLLTLTIFLLQPIFSQDKGYKIQIELEAYHDSIGYLGHYYSDKLSVADTASFKSGSITFTGSEALKRGIYFFVSQDKKKLFEFFITDDQYFKLSTRVPSSPDEMEIDGSDENVIFYRYLVANHETYTEIKSIQTQIKSLSAQHDSISILKSQIDSLNEASIEFKLQLMNEYPESMLALLFNLMREPDVPDFFSGDGRQDTLSAYLYYRKHYWDNVSMADDRILRTPVFYRKLDNYMHNVIPSHPDSVIVEIDKMIASTDGNIEMRDYLLWYFTNTYETSNVMGYDKVFVHMVDQYFSDTAYDWLNTTVQKNMIDRANQLRKLLIDEYAPELIMADTNNQFVPMSGIKADYLIVIFWVSSCSECKEEVNLINDFYKSTDLDIKIYAVNTDTTMSKWKNYIIKKQLDWIHVNGNISLTGDYHDLYDIYSTPVIYILDEEKRIIAKRLAAEKIPAFLQRRKK